jgi:hypothetical protein
LNDVGQARSGDCRIDTAAGDLVNIASDLAGSSIVTSAESVLLMMRVCLTRAGKSIDDDTFAYDDSGASRMASRLCLRGYRGVALGRGH